MITDEDFTQAMREAVEERGRDYVYPKGDPDYTFDHGPCVYQTPNGTPACIVGLAMSKLGLELPRYEDVEGAFLALKGSGMSNRAKDAAEVAQNLQDAGWTWGQALDEYLELL